MCGRFTLSKKKLTDLQDLIDFTIPPELAAHYRPRFNIAPSQPHWMIFSKDNQTFLEESIWGFVPSWSKDGKGFINARTETVFEKPSFRNACKTRRCLVPADGYFEWKKEADQKQPYWFHLPKNEGFLFAGLYEEPNSFTPKGVKNIHAAHPPLFGRFNFHSRSNAGHSF